ncbi:hypothetical protein [Aliikangiella sp. G2MR2-5]|uniref:hypothetical protein n=1 Tax=Aliikangiella sp. G2MR2-5 TaxID=2788943 RepID=UPI0018AA58FD|nr:hypothetical protein [Aliikangiella sp. G2MR2-5]
MKIVDLSTMKKYGITSEQKSIYRYKQYQYDVLQDAINYAKHEQVQSSLNLPVKVEEEAQLSKRGKDDL